MGAVSREASDAYQRRERGCIRRYWMTSIPRRSHQTPWRKPTTNGGLDGTDRPPSPGDDYEIQDLTQVAYSAIASNADPVSSTGAISVQIQNINWETSFSQRNRGSPEWWVLRGGM